MAKLTKKQEKCHLCTIWASHQLLLPTMRAWSIGPPHSTHLPVMALWPTLFFGGLAQV